MLAKLLVYPLRMFGGKFFTLFQYGNNQHHNSSFRAQISPARWLWQSVFRYRRILPESHVLLYVLPQMFTGRIGGL